ncbi:MAG TPA: hypothetical protein VLV88_11970 [Terriglobales bacterium]|nr:hypothetical protein [Terriglobales bacterium]
MISEDQALSIVRARSKNAQDVEFVVAARVRPASDAQTFAEQSLAEAQSKHFDLYEKGFFIDLMRAGAYVILEIDKKTDTAKRVQAVTLDTTGQGVVQSKDIHGVLGRDVALAIIHRSADFSEAFFNSPDTQIKDLLIKFGGPGAAVSGIPDGQGYFAVPETVKRLTTGPGEMLELTSLSNGLALWTIRHALVMPLYAANPVAAVRQANSELTNLASEFGAKSGGKGGLDFVDQLIDLDSIHTREELTTRLRLLREFSLFLDERSPLPVTSAAYRANILVSTVPLDLVAEHDAVRVYGATTAPGLISIWTRAGDGGLILKGLSVAD